MTPCRVSSDRCFRTSDDAGVPVAHNLRCRPVGEVTDHLCVSVVRTRSKPASGNEKRDFAAEILPPETRRAFSQERFFSRESRARFDRDKISSQKREARFRRGDSSSESQKRVLTQSKPPLEHGIRISGLSRRAVQAEWPALTPVQVPPASRTRLFRATRP